MKSKFPVAVAMLLCFAQANAQAQDGGPPTHSINGSAVFSAGNPTLITGTSNIPGDSSKTYSFVFSDVDGGVHAMPISIKENGDFSLTSLDDFAFMGFDQNCVQASVYDGDTVLCNVNLTLLGNNAPDYPDVIDWDRIGNDLKTILDHVKEHEQDDPKEKKHGIFRNTKSAKEWTELALKKAKDKKLKLKRSGVNWVVVVEMGEVVGTEGGKNGSGGNLTRIMLVFDDQGNLVTAYPTADPATT